MQAPATSDEGRRSAKWQARRDSIIDTSAQVFARRGYHATGITELCTAHDLGKGALYHYIGSKVAAVEYARDGIRVNCVCPGTFLSAIHADLPSEAIDAIAARHPLGLGSATDLAGVYSYLAGDDSRWTTGSAMVVDGGYSAP